MTIPSQFRSPRYNKLKRRALEIFESHGGWLSPRDWAGLANFYPVRAAYSYLKRLHQFGLLERGDGSSPVVRGEEQPICYVRRDQSVLRKEL
jgi:hypothetical protein